MFIFKKKKKSVKRKIAAWEAKSSLSTTDGTHAFRQWVREEWRGVGAKEEAVAVCRYPGESVGDTGSRKEKDKGF